MKWLTWAGRVGSIELLASQGARVALDGRSKLMKEVREVVSGGLVGSNYFPPNIRPEGCASVKHLLHGVHHLGHLIAREELPTGNIEGSKPSFISRGEVASLCVRWLWRSDAIIFKVGDGSQTLSEPRVVLGNLVAVRKPACTGEGRNLTNACANVVPRSEEEVVVVELIRVGAGVQPLLKGGALTDGLSDCVLECSFIYEVQVGVGGHAASGTRGCDLGWLTASSSAARRLGPD